MSINGVIITKWGNQRTPEDVLAEHYIAVVVKAVWSLTKDLGPRSWNWDCRPIRCVRSEIGLQLSFMILGPSKGLELEKNMNLCICTSFLNDIWCILDMSDIL